MDLDLIDHQSLMITTFRTFFEQHSTADSVRDSEKTDGFDPSLWRRFVGLGGSTLSLEDEDAGGGGALIDAALVGIEAGARVAPIPYSESVTALRLLQNFPAGGIDITAASADLVVLGDAKSPVGQSPDGLIDAQLPWARGGNVARYVLIADGALLALMDLDQPGAKRVSLSNLGHLPIASIELSAAEPLAVFRPPAEVFERARCELRVLRAAELVGAGKHALRLVQDYVVQRHQFGRPIGSFQAVQHRLADCRTMLDAAELLVLRAASYAEDVRALRYYSAVALLQTVEATELAARESLQFHGGYGFILEYDIHLYLRFAKALGVLARDGHVVTDALPVRAGGSGGG